MKIKPFKLERYFAQYEFTTPILLCTSDCQPLSLKELLSLADEYSQNLWDSLGLGYTESQGNIRLRKEISRLYEKVDPEHVVVVIPEEGIFLAMNAILKKGDHVISTFPGYQSLYEIARSMGCRVSYWQPEAGEKWHFDVKELSSLICRQTRLMVINFPHNPTGATISQADFIRLLDIAEANNITVFSDEMYRGLEYDGKDRLKSAVEISDRTISLSGLSKSFGLAGLRIGWLICKDRRLRQKIMTLKDYVSICPSAPSEALAVMAIRAKKTIIQANINILKSNLVLLSDFFSVRQNIFKWIDPQAGPVALVQWRGKKGAGLFCKQLREEEGVLLLPSTQYDFGDKHFRLGFGRENMIHGINGLKRYLNRHFKRN